MRKAAVTALFRLLTRAACSLLFSFWARIFTWKSRALWNGDFRKALLKLGLEMLFIFHAGLSKKLI